MDFSPNRSMYVVKRDGRREEVSFDKVLERIKRASDALDVNPTAIAQKILVQIYDGVKTTELDELTSQLAANLATVHPDYGTLAARISVSNHHKNTESSFTKVMRTLATQTHPKTGEALSYIHPDILAVLETHADRIDAAIQHDRDYLFDYFGFKTLEKSYLLRDANGVIQERPQHMWMRVALAMWGANLERAFETYDMMSQKYFTHATPTLFNAGTPRQQLSSCFLLAMNDDSISGIYKTLSDCAMISKHAGGIGLHCHNIRAKGSLIRGTNGTSNGLTPMLRVFNNTARYVDQGGGKRNGSFAMYLEPWHADVEDFLRLKLNSGTEEERARDLFYALWVPDLFMKRVEADGDWTLFCPAEAPGLADVVGAEFEALYERYEREGRGRKTIKAQKLWFQILDTQMETGTPYICYKDAANLKSNQQNLGVIKSSNLCVAPETTVMVKTDDNRSYANVPIRRLEGKEVQVWNGKTWSPTVVTKTGTNQKLLRVMIETTIDDNTDLTTVYCTEYHKFLLPSPTGKIADCPRIEAHSLRPEMILQGWKNYEQKWVHHEVVSVDFDGRYDDTYCFNEPENHAGVFNGVLTGNCTEIMEYSSPEETAVCNLASIGLPAFVEKTPVPRFNFDKLRHVVEVATRNLNRVIDINYYPTPETERSNMRHRPIGLGVQGLADVFALMRYAWDSQEAADLNQRIAEHIYFAALRASCKAAAKEGTYDTYDGSPMSKGQLQFDMWNVKPLTQQDGSLPWDDLRQDIRGNGVRNSLLLAPMPTASTSQILGYNECFEPFTSNIYSRRTLAGEFIVMNKYLLQDLVSHGIWTETLKQKILALNGSVQGIPEIPEEIQVLYRTAWELKQRTLIDLAAARGAFICQSQSLNLFVADPSYAKLSSMHIYSWKKGLKTGCYYLRTRAAVTAQKFTVDPTLIATIAKSTPPEPKKETKAEKLERLAREYEEEQQRAKKAAEDGEGCLMCSG